MGRVSPSDPIFGLFIRNFYLWSIPPVAFFCWCRFSPCHSEFSLESFYLLSSLQRILKQVQDDGWSVGWRTFGPTLRTDAFHTQHILHHTCLHAPETLDCRRMPSITWSGGEVTTQNSPIFFPREIKTKIQIHLNLPTMFLK